MICLKKKDKELLEILRADYERFEDSNPVPPGLSKESIVSELENMPEPEVKKVRRIPVRRLASAAAALIVVAGAAAVFNLYGGMKAVKLDAEYWRYSKKPASGMQTAESRTEIQSIFNKLSKTNQSSVRYGFSRLADQGLNIGNKTAAPESAGADTANGSDSAYGKTNTQVAGVDEPDIVKNDGRYLYSVVNGSVNIYSLLPADNLKLAAAIQARPQADGSGVNANSLFVKGNLLVVFGNGFQYIPNGAKDEGETKTEDEPAPSASSGSAEGSAGSGTTGKSAEPAPDGSAVAPDYDPGLYSMPYSYKNVTVCAVYDVTDKTAPKLLKTFTQDGSFISARLIGGKLYILSSYYVDVYATQALNDNCIPRISVDGKAAEVAAPDIYIAKDPEPSYLVATGINLDDLDAAPNKKAVLGGGSEAYCTKDSLFVSRTVYPRVTQTSGDGYDVFISNDRGFTEIYRFSIGGGKVDFDCAGKVEGTILNQFSMDEHGGYFRIATTEGEWSDKGSSNVFLLDTNLKTVGKVEKIAPGERIYAVRFMGDTGYVVTFEQTDPLFVLNLKDPAAPKITGELKLPGFSSYLHPVTDTLLLGIGQNGNDEGTLPGVKLSLFDVSNPAKPVEADKYVIEGQAYTEAMNNHKAFMLCPEKNLFGLPVTVYPAYDTIVSEDGTSKSAVVDNTQNRSMFFTFTVKGSEIVPDKQYQDAGSKGDYNGITRGTYVGDTLYTLSGSALTSFSMESGKRLDALPIAQTQPIYYYGMREPFFVD